MLVVFTTVPLGWTVAGPNTVEYFVPTEGLAIFRETYSVKTASVMLSRFVLRNYILVRFSSLALLPWIFE